jgi:hypothetical protein
MRESFQGQRSAKGFLFVGPSEGGKNRREFDLHGALTYNMRLIDRTWATAVSAKYQKSYDFQHPPLDLFIGGD